jgi:biotin synthase
VLDSDWLCPVIRDIKRQTPLAVTLSLGEKSEQELSLLREAGADRYLLRFETSNSELFQRIHPPRLDREATTVGWDSVPAPGDGSDRVPTGGQDDELGEDSPRLRQLGVARRLGYEVGSGVMVGIPGQTYRDLARDIQLFHELDLDMIGIGPYIPHPQTPLGQRGEQIRAATEDQVPADELMTYKAVALTRLMRPRANIPCTSALATLDGRRGRILCLQRGANVIMPNMTPEKYRRQYEIYPNKAGSFQTPDESDAVIKQQIQQAGRTVGRGRGDSPNHLAHAATDTLTTPLG